jgi:hypothetical protein
MTPLQRRATYGDPYDTAAWAAATEEENAAIAAQKAADAAPADLTTSTAIPPTNTLR